MLAERRCIRAVPSVDGCRTITPRGFLRFLGGSAMARCRAITATHSHLGCVFVRMSGLFVRLGGAVERFGGSVERMCSTSFRLLGCISRSQGALARFPVPMPRR